MGLDLCAICVDEEESGDRTSGLSLYYSLSTLL